jgi:hypothetical protein
MKMGKIIEEKFLTWYEFQSFITDQKINLYKYIFRGQKSEKWTLKASFYRRMDDIKVNNTDDKEAKLKEHLETFKLTARGRRGINPPVIKEENEWWALGRHHGLATPLLDWTSSPYVAIYFAFIDDIRKETENRVVYALNTIEVDKFNRRYQI